MKKVISVVLLILFLMISQTAWAGKRIVQLNLSGCADCDAENRIARILKKTKGVKKYENQGHGQIVVTFDDEITTLNIIVNQLKRGKFSLEGEPIFLK